MSDLQLTTALGSIVSMALLTVLIFGIAPKYRLDSFRQRMFALRDELWDYAAAGNIDFDDPAYLHLRKLMNGMIRYGHQLTLFRALMTMMKWRLFGSAPELTWHNKWSNALAHIESEVIKTKLEDFHARTESHVARHLFTGSPLLLLMLFVAIVCTLIASGWTSVRQIVRTSGIRSLSWLVDPALLEESAARASIAA